MTVRQTPVKMNDVLNLNINDINHRGEGVGRYHNFAVFVPQTFIGEKITAKITEVKKNYARGELIEIKEHFEERCIPRCQEYMKCGGCQLQHINYPVQLKIKEKLVRDNLQRIGGLKDVTVLPTIGMENTWHYRNKVHLQVGQKNKQTILGFYAEGSHELIKESALCRIVDDRLNEIILIIEELLNKYRVSLYNWQKKSGLLRHVILRIAQTTRQVMVILATGFGDWPEQEDFSQELQNRCPDIASIIRNINPSTGRLVLGRENKLLAGKKNITDYIGGLAFNISAHSFYQVNYAQTVKLYEKAREYAQLSGKETVIDVFCGIGTIALYLSRYAAKVIGLEAVAASIKDAQRNTAINKIKNAEFQCGAVEKLLPELAKQQLSPDVIVLDPPRQGCKQAALEAIASMNIPRVVYISCNPSTLARDMSILSEFGYRAVEVQPVDMFPQTAHVECVVRIERE